MRATFDEPIDVMHEDATVGNRALLCLEKKQLICVMYKVGRRWPSTALETEIDVQKRLLLNIMRKGNECHTSP